MTTQLSQPNHTPNNMSQQSKLVKFSHVLWPVLIVLLALTIGFWMMKTKPEAQQRLHTKNTIFVETQKVVFAPQKITIEAMGTVSAARKISISTQVGGEITSTSPNFQPGGLFKTGEKILAIDSADYQLVLRQRQADVENAQSALAMESGNQLVSQKELELLGEDVSDQERALMLRQPQLNQLKSSLQSAKAKYAQAQLDLARTKVKAPFDGIIASLSTNIGARVTTGTAVAEFIGTEEFWVEVSVPVSDLQWISIPHNAKAIGSRVHIYNDASWGKGASREGTVVRLAPSLETNGRMAQLIVKVTDPLAVTPANVNNPRLLVNSYVRAEIEAHISDSAVAIPREYIRNGNQLWILDPTSKLEIRSIETLFKNRNTVLIDQGLKTDETYITSTIAAPVEGMVLQMKSASPDTKKKNQPEKNTKNSKSIKENTNE